MNVWTISGPNVYVHGPTVAGNTDQTGGWQVTVFGRGGAFTIVPPANAPLGAYTINYGQTQSGTVKQDNLTYYGPGAAFNVISPAPRPVAGSPAFSWQGSVGGVNTGNGNKTTTLPITGWTMRGGMPVSGALYHNSQGPSYGTYGYKWTPSYFSYISGGSSAPVLHWDNGLTYAFALVSTINGVSTYNAPYGILDKLTCTNGLFTLTSTSNTVYTFGYIPGNAYLTSITDMDGNTLTINHNSDTTLSTVTDSTGRTLTYNYSGGHLSTLTDPLGRVWTFNYVVGSYLQNVVLPPVNGQTYSLYFGYGDGRQNITQAMDARGNSSSYTYNGDNSLATAKDALGNQTTFTYNANNTVITDPNGHTTTHTYQYGRLISVTDALGDTSATAYDYNNIVTSSTDKRNNTAYFDSHFSNGTTTSTSTDPLGYSSSSTYDGKNKVISSIDALGNTTLNTYTTDSKEDLLTTSLTGTGTAPFKATSQVGGYTNGLPAAFTDPLGFASSVGYDPNGDPNSATDPNSNTAAATFNALGWKMTATDANNHATTNTYDTWGRVTDVQAADNTHTKMTYDANGNVLTVTDADSHTVTNVYDADNRLIQTTNGRGDVVRYTYDGTDPASGVPQKGLLSSKTDGNSHTTTYSYTARNEAAATYYPDGTSESVTYDENGNTLTRTKADGKVIRYTYDKANRLTDIVYPTLHATHFDYDKDGRRIDMTDATGKTIWDYTYDGVHCTAQATPQGTVYYAFDADGRRTARQLVGTGSWNYTYDNGGRLIKLSSPTDGTTTLTYDAANRLLTKTKGSGDYELYAYDAADQLSSIGYWFVGGTMQNALVYSYTPGGSVQTMDQGYYNTTYAYDGANQLVGETSGGTYPPLALGFTYDHNGNRLTQTVNGGSYQSFSYNAHDVLVSGTAGAETPGYDLNGNETSNSISGGVYRFVYDEEDRLTSVAVPGGPTDTFVYNGLGLRVGKTDSTGTYSYVCDGTTPGSPVLSDGHALYTPGLSENRGGVAAYYANDRLGNLWLLDGSSKNPLTYIDFNGFGQTTAGSLGGTPFGFGGGNGCQTDVDTGLVLMGHRYYDTRIGRFISQDPAGDGDNWYEYAGNDPVNEDDPNGLMPIMSFPEGSMPQGTDQPIWASVESNAFRQYSYSQGHWTNGTATMVLQDEQGSSYAANAGEGHTTWIAGAYNPFNFNFPVPPFSQDKIDRVVNDEWKFLKEDAKWVFFGPPVALTPNQMNQQIKRGQAPKGIDRIDIGKIKGEQTHAHFDDGSALNMDGTWKHGGKVLTGDQSQYLAANGWTLP